MSKLFKIALILIVVVFVCCSCNSSNDIYDMTLINRFEQYAQDNEKEILNIWNRYDHVIGYIRDENEHSIVKMYLDEKSEIIKENGIIDKLKTFNYIQVQDKKDIYIGILITNEELCKKATDIMVEFREKIINEPHKIQISLDKLNSTIIDYTSESIKDIKEISLLNKEGKIIYTEKID